MLSRILFSTIAAATLLVAAPALAAEGTSKQQCSCCSDGSVHETDHPLREEAQQARDSMDTAAPGTTEDDPFVRNQSFGG